MMVTIWPLLSLKSPRRKHVSGIFMPQNKKERFVMKSINTYGLKMSGLRRAAGETKGLTGYYSGHYVQISYDTSDGEILTDYHYNLGQNWWTQYHNPSIITVCNASSSMTMQEIADRIAEAVAWRELEAS